jgi:hypothetical protein
MSAYSFVNPFDFQPTSFNQGGIAPSADGSEYGMITGEAVLGDYFKRVVKEHVFPKEVDAEEDIRSEEEKAKDVGKEMVSKSESLMPKDTRKDPYAEFSLADSSLPPEEELLDDDDIFGSRLDSTRNVFPRVKPRKVKSLKQKKPPKIRNSLPQSKLRTHKPRKKKA